MTQNNDQSSSEDLVAGTVTGPFSDPTKIIFLDIDGVLNSWGSYYALGGYPHTLQEVGLFDWVAIGLLQRLCKSDANIKIVMSSSWRLSFPADAFTKAFDLPVIDNTPGDDTESRGEEIRQWLAAHPTIRNYVIIDDNDWVLPHQRKRFVKTDPDVGLTFHNIRKVMRILGCSTTAFSDVKIGSDDIHHKIKLPGSLTVRKAKEHVATEPRWIKTMAGGWERIPAGQAAPEDALPPPKENETQNDNNTS